MKSSENSLIIETVRALRRKSTKGESILWQKLKVIRFKNEEVENNFENVVSKITKKLS